MSCAIVVVSCIFVMMSSHGYALHFSVILSNHISIGGKCKGPCPEGDIGAKRLWEVSPLFSQVLAEWFLQLHFKWPGCGASVPCLGYGVEGKPERAPLFGMFSRDTQRKPPILPGSEAPIFRTPFKAARPGGRHLRGLRVLRGRWLQPPGAQAAPRSLRVASTERTRVPMATV